MSKPEYSGVRDLSYSAWHRTLKDKCYAMNIDYLEIRNKKIVAIIEEKDDRSSGVKGWNKDILIQVADALKVQPLVVYHNLAYEKDKSKYRFTIVNLKTKHFALANESQYRKFIEELT